MFLAAHASAFGSGACCGLAFWSNLSSGSAFLFLLTSSLAPLINLSYLRMVYMALPYTIVLSIVGYTAINLFL